MILTLKIPIHSVIIFYFFVFCNLLQRSSLSIATSGDFFPYLSTSMYSRLYFESNLCPNSIPSSIMYIFYVDLEKYGIAIKYRQYIFFFAPNNFKNGPLYSTLFLIGLQLWHFITSLQYQKNKRYFYQAVSETKKKIDLKVKYFYF